MLNPDSATDNNLRSGDAIPADAPKGNWVDLYAPPLLRPWLRLSRADRPIGTWLLLLPCWWGIGLAMIATGPAWRDIWIAAACLVGAAVMRGAGCTWNDIADRKIDGSVERTRNRPLPSGQVSLTGAYIWLAFQALIGLGILLTLGRAAIWMGAISLVPVLIYPFAKRFTWWPQFFLGIAFNWGVMLAWAAHTGGLGVVPVIAWLGGIAWTIHYDTIYAHQDAEDDALIGVRSTARLFGARSGLILTGFAALAAALLAAAVTLALASANMTGFVQKLLAYGALAGFSLHLVWQLLRFDRNDGDRCLQLFRSNRDAGLILAAGLVLAGLF